MQRPLDGLVVFDLTRILAGPSCTQILGDLGAVVIEIERRGAGDDTRNFAPPYLPRGDGTDSSESAYFAGTNRNKRSGTLNLGHSEGQALARRLIAGSDSLAENFKTGTLAKYGCQFRGYHKALMVRRSYKRAIVATARTLLRVLYVVLRDARPYQDPEADYEEFMVRRNAPRWIRTRAVISVGEKGLTT